MIEIKPCRNGHTSPRRTDNRDCIECARERSVRQRRNKPEQVKATLRAWYERNKDYALERAAAWAAANPEKVKQAKAKWQAANPGKARASRNRRTPRWLTNADNASIRGQYDFAALMTWLVGVPYHVDHIIPLQGKLVSGLHVPSNLRVIRGADNIAKGNRFEAR